MKLSKRLAAVADMVPFSASMADIGTDHGYIPIYLIKEKRIKKAVAADIHKGPLVAAEEHIHEEHLENQIETRMGSGLSVLKKNEVDGVVIAGMGGLMIESILENDGDIAKALDWLVLQPQNHISELRIWLQKKGYQIEREILIQEKEHLYEALYVTQGEMKPFDDMDAEIGVTEGRYGDPLFPSHLKKLINKRNSIIQNIDGKPANERNRKKLKKAIQDKVILEGILWKCLQKISSD